MAEPDDIDEDLFADLWVHNYLCLLVFARMASRFETSPKQEFPLTEADLTSYEGDEDLEKPTPAAAAQVDTNGDTSISNSYPSAPSPPKDQNQTIKPEIKDDAEPQIFGDDIYGDTNMTGQNNQSQQEVPHVVNQHGFTGTVGIKEDG